MIEPKLAPVRPRILMKSGDAPELLEDLVRCHLDSGDPGIIELEGSFGVGKRSALGHLAHIFADEPRLLLLHGIEGVDITSIFKHAKRGIVIYGRRNAQLRTPKMLQWKIARWGRDEWIEYLLAMHREQCASVMRRIAEDPNWGTSWLASPCRRLLDILAGDEQIATAKEALRRFLDPLAPTPPALHNLRFLCFQWVTEASADKSILIEALSTTSVGSSTLEKFGVLDQLAAEYLAMQLRTGSIQALEKQFSYELVRETAALVRHDEQVLARLEVALASGSFWIHPMAASLLHAALPAGLFHPRGSPLLHDAYLSHVRWGELSLGDLRVSGADLSHADLHDVRLTTLKATRANLANANLLGARIHKLIARSANFESADLSYARIHSADCNGACVRDAKLESALLMDAVLAGGDLTRANFRRAQLLNADLTGCKIADADFSGADLSQAELTSLELYRANFAGACFASAVLCDCNLQGMTLPGANFDKADLMRADMTGSVMPHVRLRGANLSNSKLAEISWENADLRDANLQGCTFHFGSTRSGLVGSPIASEGTRTGFYTDDLLDQDFQPPEVIRKANLGGADLRGAKIHGVDFYLVDLRDAQFTPKQQEQLERSGAILKKRV